MQSRLVLRLFLALLLIPFCLTSCGPRRPPVPIGEVPKQYSVSAEDEEYGQEVFRELSRQYALDNNDARIKRVRDVVDRLTAAAGVDRNPWHIELFDDPDVANAAATRGNYIFVWSGIFRDVEKDEEIAAILAHELAHVLAGHTAADPIEEVQRIISGVAGDVAGQIVSYQGPYAVFADLAALLVRETLAAMIVNPGQQQDELEADQVGLFIMADAGYDPNAAFSFWDRVKDRPGYDGGFVSLLSSHPSSEERLQQIQQLLPEATARFIQATTTAPTGRSTHDRNQKLPDYRVDQSSRPKRSKPPDVSGGEQSEWVWDEALPPEP